MYGFSSKWTQLTYEVIESIKSGKPVIAHMGPGIFADNGHYILLTGIEENGDILINDPNSRERTGQAYPISTIRSQLKVALGFGIIK